MRKCLNVRVHGTCRRFWRKLINTDNSMNTRTFVCNRNPSLCFRPLTKVFPILRVLNYQVCSNDDPCLSFNHFTA